MAILTEGAGSSQMGSATSPMQAVQEPSALSSLAGLAQGGLSVLNTRNQANAVAAKAQAVADKEATKFAGEQEDTALSQELLKISTLFAQKGDRQGAISKSRLALTRALNSPGNDGRGDELIATYTKFMAVEGLGKDFFEQSDAEKARATQIDIAAKNGVQFLDTDSEEVIQAKIDNSNAYLRSQEALKATSTRLAAVNAELTRQGKVITNESSKLALEKTKLESKQAEALAGMADGFNTILQDNFQNARTLFDSTGDGTAALMEIENSYSGVRNLINATAGTGNADQVQALTSTMTNLYQFNKDYVSNKLTREQLENKSKIENQRLVNLMYEKNPNLQQMIAASNLIGNMDAGLSMEIGAQVIKFLDSAKNAKPLDIASLTAEEQKGITDTAMNFIVEDTAGGLSPAHKAEGMAIVTKIFTDLDKYSASVDSPQQLNQLVSMMADPRFGEWVKANKGVPASISASVKETLKAYYSEPVLKDVVQNWEKDVAIDQKTFGFDPMSSLGGMSFESRMDSLREPRPAVMALPDILEPFMTESGLSFRAKQGAPQNLVAPALKQVNTTVLPKINRLIKSMTHIEGSTDYNKVFEENYSKILGVSPEETKAEPKPKAPLASEEYTPLEGDTIEAGAVVGGYKFNGGDTTDPANWSKVNE